MITGETIATGAPNPKGLKFQVCKSAAGFYVGTFDPELGPWTRETGYYATRELAQAALDRINQGKVDDLRK